MIYPENYFLPRRKNDLKNAHDILHYIVKLIAQRYFPKSSRE